MFGAERLLRLILVDEAAAVTGNPSWPQEEREALDCLFPGPINLAEQYQKVLTATDAEATADLLSGMFTAEVAREDSLWIAAENIKLAAHPRRLPDLPSRHNRLARRDSHHSPADLSRWRACQYFSRTYAGVDCRTNTRRRMRYFRCWRRRLAFDVL